MDCYACELEPGRFGLAVEVGGEGLVEDSELGQICFDASVDCMFEILVRKAAEDWECSANSVCVVAMFGAGVHVVKGLDVIELVFVLCPIQEGGLETMVVPS